MAKVRVYELAKELNLESKDLVEQLIAEGIDVKNYMSTLDDESAAKARQIVSGEISISEVIEERRIKSTVIRRRKKLVKVEQEHSPEEAEVEIVSEETGPSLEEFKEIDGAAQDGGTEESIITETEKEEKDTTKTFETEGKLEKKAGIAPGDASEAGTQARAVEKEIKPGKIKPIKESGAKAKKAKKKQTDQPAKIIKLPEEGALGGILARKIKKKTIEKGGIDTTLEISPKIPEEIPSEQKKVKPAKRKRDKKKTEIEEAQVGREYRRRKKEIYERAELYEGRPFKHKAKPVGKKAKEAVKKVRQTEITVPKPIKRRLKVQELVTVAELAKAMGTKSRDLMAKLMGLGVTSHINQPLDFETASVVADEFGYELELDTFEEEQVMSESEDIPEDLKSRPPVVTIMGHVDHGKTSLLDYIRKSNIIGGESGGITQHIGAYYVALDKGDIVFLDTPGHEAFTAMRARGAKVTDIIVLVVAADDGVMPQTKEAINHARAANIPILVAINKIDKPEADQEKVRRELADLELVPEDWGGETIYGNISAKTGEGIEDLLGLILLQAEMLEIQANPEKPARGTIIEAKLDKSKGPVSTVLIKNGTLRQGDYFICGDHYGKVRAMLDHRGKKMKSAGPSAPVEIYGISGVPMAGDALVVVQDERTAKHVIEHRRAKTKKPGEVRQGLISLDEFFERVKDSEVKELNIILKTDVQGSLEALTEALIKLSTEEVRLKVIHSATGTITESDVMLASASGGIIIGFNVRANPRVTGIAEKEKVDIRYYDVIYNATKDIRLAMAGLLDPTYEERIIGRADIKEIFRVPKVGTVAGCQVTEGHIERNANVRLLRDDVVVFDGKLASLRRFKDDAKEVQSGYECGIGLENFQDIKPGDVFEAYVLEEVQAEL